MTQKEIHDSLDAMLENPKSKPFLNHLVRSYFPISNVDKVWDKPEGSFKCVLTKQELISVQEVMVGLQTEEFKNAFFLSLKSFLNEDERKVNPMTSFLGGKVLGLTGTKTTTFMSYEGLQEFINWVLTKSIKGDKHINWLLSSIRKNSFVGSIKNHSKSKPKVNKENESESKVSTYTIGETDAFKKLREKFND